MRSDLLGLEQHQEKVEEKVGLEQHQDTELEQLLLYLIIA